MPVISYRVAELSDARFMFDLKNDQKVRESSILARNGVQWHDHLEWLGRTLANRKVELWIILQDGDPIGTWRMEHLSSDRVEVAIHLSANERRNGVGSKVLADWCRGSGVEWLARIVDANWASIRLFAKAGFQARGEVQGDAVPYRFYEYGVQDP